MTSMSGGCACGRIRFTAEVEGDKASLCHCRMCQRSSGNVSLALKEVGKADVNWSIEPDWFESSPIARRPFCSTCGTSLGFAFRDGERMELTVASFDEPDSFVPTKNFGAESIHPAWLDASRLPQEQTANNPNVVDRWVRTTGSFPG